MSTQFDRVALIQRLEHADGPADLSDAFPDTLWSILREAGATVWSIPQVLGGEGCDRETLLDRFAVVAQGSLTAAFILSQHDAALRRLLAVGPDRPVAVRWLEAVVSGEAFATIGVSQLTTSRRLGVQALRIMDGEDGSRTLEGAMPWVTAADRADVFVTGAVQSDGRQVLFAIPSNRPGLEVKPPFALAALGASRTTEIVCSKLVFDDGDRLAGPSADVMAHTSAAGTGGLETSALALGQARAAVIALEAERPDRSELAEPVEALRDSLETAWRELLETAKAADGSKSSAQIRSSANGLALRATQAYLTARRGRGFLKDDPAQRWARQALFFLVWSCPSPVANAAIRELAGVCSL